jgi:hypothetical protein
VREGRNPFEDELSEEELEAHEGTQLPDREAMSVIGDVAIPLDPNLAADVLLEPGGSVEGSDPPIAADDIDRGP